MESLFFHENPFGRLAIFMFQREARLGCSAGSLSGRGAKRTSSLFLIDMCCIHYIQEGSQARSGSRKALKY